MSIVDNVKGVLGMGLDEYYCWDCDATYWTHDSEPACVYCGSTEVRRL